MKFGQSLAVSLAALLCTTSLALAQAPDKGGGMGGGAAQAPAEKMERGPAGGGANRGQDGGPSRAQTTPDHSSRGMSQAGEGRRAEPRSDRSERAQGGERSSGRGERSTGKAERPDTGREPNRAAQTGRERDQDKMQRTDQRKGQDQDRAARERQTNDQQKAQSSTRERNQEKAQRTDRDREQGKAAERRTPDRTGQAQPANRVQASEKQHAEVRQHLLRDRRVERSKLNVSVNIGATVPRSVRLHSLSAAVIGFAPVYRGYSYVVLEDETICIVDPRSYVIVDVIPASTQRAELPSGGHLSLSADERRLVLASVDRRQTADIDVRLALGAEIPRSVEVERFPDRVIERIPKLGSYRYVVTQDQVIILDPSDRQVALLISD
jgi:uncharacterized protein DUF1236